jgi:ABC-2 type transport system permease protein
MYIFRKTLLDYRRSVAIWGIGLALLMLTVGTAYNGVIGGPDKVQQIASLQKIANSFAFLIGKAYDLDTFGGFVTTRYMGVVPVLLAIFALLAGNALIRGEEEQGSLDLLLSTPHSRATVYLQKMGRVGGGPCGNLCPLLAGPDSRGRHRGAATGRRGDRSGVS